MVDKEKLSEIKDFLKENSTDNLAIEMKSDTATHQSETTYGNQVGKQKVHKIPLMVHVGYVMCIGFSFILGMLMPDQTVSSANTALSGGSVNISGNNNFVSNGKPDVSLFSAQESDGVYFMKWNDMAYEPRRMYRGMVYAYFPQVVLGDDSVDWTQIQTWLRENHHLDIPNVKKIMSEESRDDLPKSIATLLFTVDKAYQTAGLDDHRQFIKYWPIEPASDRNERKFQWAAITLNYVSQKYDPKIVQLVKNDLQTEFKQK